MTPAVKKAAEKKGAAKDAAAAEAGERIAKRIARAGVCSRREAETWIAQGRVAVDGETLTTPAVTVTAGQRITIDGEPLAAPEPTRLWRYHKPAGLVTTNRDPQGRPTVFGALPDHLPRVLSVGRLDLTTEGLLLLTNDGELARHLELPATGWKRRYRVRVHGRVQEAALKELAAGLTVEGVRYGAIEARLDRQQGANAWLTLALKEGKNREIRRVCEHLGWTVNRLIRVAYGPFQLGALPEGEVEEVPAKTLREQLGDRFDLPDRPLSSRAPNAPRPAAKPARPPRKRTKPRPPPEGAEDTVAAGAGGGTAARPGGGHRRKPFGRQQADRQFDRQPDRQADRSTERQSDGQSEKPAGKPRGKWTAKRDAKPDAKRGAHRDGETDRRTGSRAGGKPGGKLGGKAGDKAGGKAGDKPGDRGRGKGRPRDGAGPETDARPGGKDRHAHRRRRP